MALHALQTVVLMTAPERALREAAKWVLNVIHGMGKGGGNPEPGEYEAAADALSTALARAEGEPHPEAFCERCGRRNVVWFAPNEVWNRAVPEGGILCPVCFVEAAERAGIRPPAWSVTPENPPAPDARPEGPGDSEPPVERVIDLMAALKASLKAREEET